METLHKAQKGTAEYEEWLRKYREKRGKKADTNEAKNILKEKDSDARSSGEKGRDTLHKKKEETFKSLENLNPETFNEFDSNEREAAEASLRHKVLSELNNLGEEGSSKFKFLGKEYTVNAQTNVAKESTANYSNGSYQVVRATTTYTVSNPEGKEISKYTAKSEWYPKIDDSARSKVGKKIYVAPNANTSGKASYAIVEDATRGISKSSTVSDYLNKWLNKRKNS